MSGFWIASFLALWVLVLVEGFLFLALLRQVGVLHVRLAPRGAMGLEHPAPGFRLSEETFVSTSGRPIVFRANRGRRLLALFVSPDCSVCGDVMPGVRTLLRERHELDLVIGVAAEDRDAAQYVDRYGVNAPTVAAPDLLKRLSITAAPFAASLDEDGQIIAGGVVNSLEQLESVLDEPIADRRNQSTLKERKNGDSLRRRRGRSSPVSQPAILAAQSAWQVGGSGDDGGRGRGCCVGIRVVASHRRLLSAVRWRLLSIVPKWNHREQLLVGMRYLDM